MCEKDKKSRTKRCTGAHNKTRRRFLPNLHNKRIWVESEQRYIKLRVSQKGLRIIDKQGIDKVLARLRAKGVKV